MSFLKQAQQATPRASFTLIELLIVIGIVAILAVVTVVVLNPAELLKQSRDSKRLTDLTTLNKALKLVEVEVSGASFGTSTIVYTSLADSSSTCGSWGLPALPAGYTYNCVATTSRQSTDGTGWVPVNFTLASTGSPISSLPVDPVNSSSTGQYYTYVPGGSWELTAIMEASRYKLGGSKDRVSEDGGDNYGLLEVGSNLSLNPVKDTGIVGYWKFDEGSETSTKDSSNNGNDGTLTNSSMWSTGQISQGISFNGSTQISIPSTPSMRVNSFTISFWVKHQGDGYIVANCYGACSYQNQFRLRTSSGSVLLYVVTSQGNASSEPNLNIALSSGQWAHVAVSYDGTTTNATGYLNGVLKGQATLAAGQSGTYSNGLMYLGSGNATSYYNGSLDDVRIYNRALSAAEIQAIYNATR